MWRTAYFIAIGLFLGIVSYVVPPGPFVVGWSLLVGVVAFFGIRFVNAQIEDQPTEVAAMVVSGGATLLGWILKLVHLRAQTGWFEGIGVVAAVGTAWALDALTTTAGSKICFICKQPAGDRPFSCPRCRQTICARPSCWIARHARCKWCHEREVVFPTTEEWWKRQVGPRVTTGNCSGPCLKEAYETDLRACPRCRWPFCKRCWDRQNFTCTHCGWVMPDLPKALAPFVAVSPPPAFEPNERISRRRP
jgi:hypothetical protein